MKRPTKEVRVERRFPNRRGRVEVQASACPADNLKHDLQRAEPEFGAPNELSTELLILPDGRVLVQNLTQPMAEILRKLNPRDQQIAPRALRRHASRITHQKT